MRLTKVPSVTWLVSEHVFEPRQSDLTANAHHCRPGEGEGVGKEGEERPTHGGPWL